MSTELALIPPTLPLGWCPTSEQERATRYFSLAAALLPSSDGWTLTASQTAPTTRTKTVWMKLDLDDRPTRLYLYKDGYWLAPHTIEPSSSERKLWVGVEADLWAYDGGDGTDPATGGGPTAFTGAMWEVDHDFDFRIPMGAGTSPDSTVLAVGANLGAELITLDEDQLKHVHPFGLWMGTNDDGRFLMGTTVSIDSTSSKAIHGDTGDPQTADVTTADLITAPNIALQDGSAKTKVNITPPVRGVYMIQRTARKYYVG